MTIWPADQAVPVERSQQSPRGHGLHIGALSFAGKPDIFYGALLIVILFFAPNGAAGLLQRAWRWYLHRRTAVRSPLPEPVAER